MSGKLRNSQLTSVSTSLKSVFVKKVAPAAMAAMVLATGTFTHMKRKESGVQLAYFQGEFTDFQQQALNQDKLGMIKFTREYCHPCSMLDENIFSNPAFVSYLDKNFVSYEINAANLDGNGQKLLEQYEVTSFPTTILVEASGVPLLQVNGNPTLEEFRRALREAQTIFPSENYKQVDGSAISKKNPNYVVLVENGLNYDETIIMAQERSMSWGDYVWVFPSEENAGKYSLAVGAFDEKKEAKKALDLLMQNENRKYKVLEFAETAINFPLVESES